MEQNYACLQSIIAVMEIFGNKWALYDHLRTLLRDEAV